MSYQKEAPVKRTYRKNHTESEATQPTFLPFSPSRHRTIFHHDDDHRESEGGRRERMGIREETKGREQKQGGKEIEPEYHLPSRERRKSLKD